MTQNPNMGITQTIRENLRRWMQPPSELDSVVKVAARSGVPRESVRRAWNGEGNLTVRNLEGIASAFGKSAADLVSSQTEQSRQVYAAEEPPPAAHYIAASRRDTRLAAVGKLLAEIDDDGLVAVIERLEDLSLKYPRRKYQKGAR